MILVTGGSGLVGKELITQLLAQGKQVRAIYNKTPLPDFKSSLLEQSQCDILDVVSLEQVMQDIEQVYHCAAIVSFDPGKKQQLFKVNVEGTANVVNAALDAGVKKLVHVSSVAALGRIGKNEPVVETMNWDEDVNNSNYGHSKYLGEMEVWRGTGEGLNAVIVNPVIILGDGDWEKGSGKIFKNIYEEFPWYSEGVNGFVDVRDVVQAMTQLMDSDIINERFILSAADKSYRAIFDLIATAFGKRLPDKKITPLLAQLVWRREAIKTFFSRKEPLVTKETAYTALNHMNFDNSKLKKFIPGFNYRPIEQTIVDICDLLQQKLNSH
jgi:nucleoside-diphosphate-sugar epimerase